MKSHKPQHEQRSDTNQIVERLFLDLKTLSIGKIS